MSKITLPTNLRDQAIKLFKKYDVDGSNFIDYSELKLLLTDIANECGITEPTDEEIDYVLKEIDDNSDRRISKDEFLELYKVIYIIQNGLI